MLLVQLDPVVATFIVAQTPSTAPTIQTTIITMPTAYGTLDQAEALCSWKSLM